MPESDCNQSCEPRMGDLENCQDQSKDRLEDMMVKASKLGGHDRAYIGQRLLASTY